MSAGLMVMNDAEPGPLPRFALPLAASALALLALLLAATLLRPVVDRPVTTLVIEGSLQRLSAGQITAAVGETDTPRLFTIDLAAIRARVEALPWVAHARVSRVWPDRIAVRVTERVPFARWGENSLIDSESHVFTPPPADIPAELPHLSAPEGHEAETAVNFQALYSALADSPFKPIGLSQDARGEWRLQTLIGIELRLGQGDPQAKTALLLGAVRRTLADQLPRVAYIDLRYANGFSVGFKDGMAPSTVATKKTAAAPTVENSKR